MPNLTFASLRGTRTAIHCSTKTELTQVRNIVGRREFSATDEEIWKIGGAKYTGISVKGKGFEYDSISMYSRLGYTIIPAADFIAANSGVVEPPKSEARHYEISFGNHLQCLIEVTNNEIKVTDAVNGWGDNVPLAEIKITAIGQIKAEARRVEDESA